MTSSQKIHISHDHEVQLDSLYVLATPGGSCWTWRYNQSGFYDKRFCPSIGATASVFFSGMLINLNTLDPITAISLGLVTIEELLASKAYPEGFIALLNLLKIN